MHIDLDDLILANTACCSKSKVASENGKRFEIISQEDFTKIRIDGCLITSHNIEKCDFGFVRHTNKQFYFVELKGKEIQKAYNQIIATINYFNAHFIVIPKDMRFGFIICSSVPKAGISANILKQDFAKKFGKKLEIKNKEFHYRPT
jgi:uncharacterized protein YjbI with pentapeptide repeats